MESLQGNLLIGGAGIIGPAFRQTVVLVAEHNPEGALGFVLNRPAHASLGEVPEPLDRLPLVDREVFVGGPVEPEVVAIIGELEQADPSDRLIFGRIGLLSLEDSTDPSRVMRAKLFAGYSGWGPGQLEAEMEQDSWIVEPALSEDVFTDDAEGLWRKVLDRKGPEYQLLQTMPYDPSSN